MKVTVSERERRQIADFLWWMMMASWALAGAGVVALVVVLVKCT